MKIRQTLKTVGVLLTSKQFVTTIQLGIAFISLVSAVDKWYQVKKSSRD